MSVTKHKKTFITHMIGSLNSLKSMNDIIKREQSKISKPKHTVVKKLFEEEEPEIEQGDSGGSLPVEEDRSCFEEQKSS